MKALQHRLDLIIDRVESPKFLKNDGLGNEIGFWVFDYPAKHELLVREHLELMTNRLHGRGYKFENLNIFQILVTMLEERGIFNRACQREKKVGIEAIKKTLSGPLSQEKVAKFIASNYDIEQMDFLILSGLGSAWPLVRGHELLSALQDVMGSTPMILFYPGEYSGTDLHPFGIINSQNYYRAFKLVPESGNESKY